MTAASCLLLLATLAACSIRVHAFQPPLHAVAYHHHVSCRSATSVLNNNKNDEEEEWSDFDGYVGHDSSSDEALLSRSAIPDFDIVDENSSEDDTTFTMKNILENTAQDDLSACQARYFRLGEDLQITRFAGSLGFEQVTDWEYYYSGEDDDDRKVVSPSPLDPSKPRRTRESSGSVVRLFRGELGGRLGATLRAQGLDARVLIKEFSGTLALELAQAELASIGKLQSLLLKSRKMDSMVQTALARSTTRTRQDDGNLCALLQLLQQQAPFTGILGEVNVAELLEEDDFDKNEWYRALSVPPPKLDSIWIVYEYTGLSTAAAYSQPPLQRISKMPLQRGMFGNVVAPPALPPFPERAKYVRLGIIQQALEGVATLHDAGIIHNSIGKSSILLFSKALDKNEASSPYATNVARLRIKLADFGFSTRVKDVTRDAGFVSRAKSFGLQIRQGETLNTDIERYAMAEDLHALGVAVLGLLLSTLAEVPSPQYKLPDTDEDTLQRLVTDIFDKDIQQFREYVEAEEVWTLLVEYLDEYEGWDFLESLLFARENAAGGERFLTARELLSSSKFLQR